MRRISGFALLALASAASADPSPATETPLRPLVTLDSLSARLDKLEEQSRNQGLLSLLNQVEAIKSEVARLRGAQDELAHRQQLADTRQKEVLADFDDRLKEIRAQASRPVPAPAPAVAVVAHAAEAPVPAPAPAEDPEAETRAYEAGLNLFKATDYAGSINAFNAFLDKYPSSPLAGNACYWLALTYFARGDHKSAVATQQRLLRDYPQHAKVPDAMVNMARAQIQLGQTEEARHVLNEVAAKYPNTRSAELAKKILSLFK
ncbi:MAG: tol-pal system protein YbgF [Gallionellaceae bacterium]|nr:tol-pal system protein YbgF [Gallionellaceae bacterium]